jgi:hypothetical protein
MEKHPLALCPEHRSRSTAELQLLPSEHLLQTRALPGPVTTTTDTRQPRRLRRQRSAPVDPQGHGNGSAGQRSSLSGALPGAGQLVAASAADMSSLETPGTRQPVASNLLPTSPSSQDFQHCQWRIRVTRGAIAGEEERSLLQRTCLCDLHSLPSMLFTQNNISIERYCGNDAAEGFQPILRFNAVDALREVQPAPAAPPQVHEASAWQRQVSSVARVPLTVAKDWTFTTTYAGTLADHLQIGSWRPVPVSKALPLTELQSREIPPEFYTELILFEDELDDQGISSYSVRIRVMRQAFWYLLARFWLRIDRKLVRIYDTRYFHRFGSSVLVRQVQRREASMETVQRAILSGWHASMSTGAMQCRPDDKDNEDDEDAAEPGCKASEGVSPTNACTPVEDITQWRATYHCTDADRVLAFVPIIEQSAEVLDLRS